MSAFIPTLIIKLTLVLAAGITINSLLRAAAPSLRHVVLLATIASALVLPLAMLVSPRWDVPVLPETSLISRAGNSSATSTVSSPRALQVTPPARPAGMPELGANTSAVRSTDNDRAAPASSRLSSTLGIIPIVWVAGFGGVLAWLTIGRIRLTRIGRSAWQLNSPDWTTLLSDECADASVEKTVRLCSSPVVSTPLTWGWRQPVILLPEDAIDWSEEHRRIVLRHELAHIARHDSLAQLVGGIACALYWFHPLVWAAERRLRAECERACDDRVVSLGTPPTDYAAHLLEVARSARAFGAPGFLSVAMARPSQLEGRLLAVLSETRQRAALSRSARRSVAVLCGLVLIPLAAFRAVPTVSTITTVAASPGVAPQPPGPMSGVKSSNQQSFTTKPVAKKIDAVPSTRFDSAFTLSTPVRPGGTLDLDLSTGGTVTITGWDRAEVAVQVRLRGRDWRDSEVHLSGSDGNATLDSRFNRSGNTSTSNAFTISVPRNFNVHVKSSGGAVSISGVAGNFTGNTGGGDVTITNASGRADLHTGGGDIEASNSHLDGVVSTGGGNVKIEGVDGNLSGMSGSGPVTYIQSGKNGTATASASGSGTGSGSSTGASTVYVDGGNGRGAISSSAFRMTTGGGDISVPEAPNGAYVTTGGGHIRVGPSGGEVYAQTGGGPIDIGPAAGSVEAVTGSGDVRIQLQGPDNHSVRVSAGTGEVTLYLPADMNATLDLETAYTDKFGRKTRITGDFPVTTTETSSWDDSHGTPRRYVRARQNIGRGGAVIRVRTVNGDINLVRR